MPIGTVFSGAWGKAGVSCHSFAPGFDRPPSCFGPLADAAVRVSSFSIWRRVFFRIRRVRVFAFLVKRRALSCVRRVRACPWFPERVAQRPLFSITYV